MNDFARPDPDTLGKLKAIVGENGWKAGDEASGRYLDDPRERYHGQASLVLLPRDTDAVSRIVGLCNETGTGLIPFGGGTGVVAGQLSIASKNAVVVSMERMNKVRQLSLEDYAMVAEAGCILENIHAAAAGQGMMFPLSMASKGSCTIGGNLATNAGGIQVVRHGNARDLCLGVEAVLPNGDVYNGLSALRKNNTGYDLRHLLIGSEGTLGIITAACLVLKPMDEETVTAFCALSSPASALKTYQALRRTMGDRLAGLELMSGFGVDLVTSHFPALKKPFGQTSDWYLLVEAGGGSGIEGELEQALAGCLESETILDAVIARSQGQSDELWQLREMTPEANRLEGAICNSDTSVPISRVEEFIAETTSAIANVHPGLRINSYGHIGDGNIHHNVFAPRGMTKAELVAAHPQIRDDVREAINEATLKCDGSISAEHGIGRLKTGDLKRHAEQSKLAVFRQLKQALDPGNIMNPGALLA